MADPVPYPVHVDATLDHPLSRWLWLVKWLLAIPHYILLIFLWLAFLVLSVAAFFAILFTGRYPRSLFEFNLGVMRWSWRVAYYGYGALGTDRYPPFTLADVPDYPARLDVAYPEHLSRGLVLVKWWLLAIPHYFVTALFVGSGTWVVYNADDEIWKVTNGFGLIGVLVCIAAVVLAFTGSYPKPVYDFVLGMNRWIIRVGAYAGLMTDVYPPFRLDMGEHEPIATPAAGPESAVAGAVAAGVPGPGITDSGVPATSPPHAGPRWTAGRVVALAIGALVLLPGAALATAGGVVLVGNAVARDDAGFVTSQSIDLSSPGYAVLTEDVLIDAAGPDWAYPQRILDEVRVRAESLSGQEVFVGIADSRDAALYLSGSAYSTIASLRGRNATYRQLPGAQAPASPSAQDIWVASQAGAGEVAVTWPVQQGEWTVVIMNADASRGVAVRADVGATVPALPWVGGLMLGFGLLLLVVGAVLVALAAHSASRAGRTAEAGGV